MAEDADGALWFGTEGYGVSRYDGVTWTTFVPDGLRYQIVSAIQCDASGVLWFGTEAKGVTRYDGSTWINFREADGLASDHVTSIEQDQSGALWFGTLGSGASRYDGATWTTFDVDGGGMNNRVSAIKMDTSGALWFGTFLGVSRLDGETWTTFTTSDGLAGLRILAIEEDASGAMWFATSAGVSRYDGSTWTTFTTADGLVSDNVLAIKKGLSGAMWFGSQSGASLYDGRGWTTFTTGEGLGSDYVSGIELDSSGALWFSGVGATRFDGSFSITFTAANGLAGDNVRALEFDTAGQLWVGTNGGVSRFDGEVWISFTAADGLVSNDVYAIEEDASGILWFGGEGGVSRYDGTSWTTFTTADGLANDTVLAIKQHSSGDLWFGFNSGITRYDGVSWRTFNQTYGWGAEVRGIEEDSSGLLWFATSAPAVRTYDGVDWDGINMPHGLALTIHEDSSGVLWFGTTSGVNHLDGATWTIFSDIFGNVPGPVNAILEDSWGHMWFGSSGGVRRFDGGIWSTLDVSDGLPVNGISEITQDVSGDFWFGSSGGVTRHRLDRTPPRSIFLRRPLPVSANSNPTALFGTMFAEVGILFSYSFDGALWSPWSSVSTWSGQSVPDGMHTLEMRTRDRMNVDQTPVMIQFEIDTAPPAPVISSPVYGQVVGGMIPILGVASDSRFLNYEIEISSADEESATVLIHSLSPPDDNSLGVWRTDDFPDGSYDIQLSVSDTIGLSASTSVRVVVDNHYPPADMTTPVRIVERDGGDVFTLNDEARVYFPPGSFEDGALVTIALSDTTVVPDTLESGAKRVLPGIEISWDGIELRKSAVMSLSLDAISEGTDIEALSIYSLLDESTWSRLGGAVDGVAGRIVTSITAPGRYALFEDSGRVLGTQPGTDLSLTPRVFSPTGGFTTGTLSITFSLMNPTSAIVMIHNRSGRLIREVSSGRAFNAGVNVVQWDGRNSEGHLVEDGLYVVSVRAFGETRVSTLAVVR